jgi:hypothetical protein
MEDADPFKFIPSEFSATLSPAGLKSIIQHDMCPEGSSLCFWKEQTHDNI